jgi:hypothetical protein
MNIAEVTYVQTDESKITNSFDLTSMAEKEVE